MTQKKVYQLSGSVSYSVKIKYKWLTEPGACEVCKAMHGKLYNKEEVPIKPHPNCKCHVEEVSIIDPAISKQYEYKEEFTLLKIEAMKLLGDLNIVKKNLNNVVNLNNVINLQNEDIAKEKEQLNKKIYDLETQIKELIDELNIHPLIFNGDFIQTKAGTIQEIIQQINQLNRKIDDLRIKNKKLLFDKVVKSNTYIGKDAAALWKLATSKFEEGTDYVEINGYIVNKLSDLKDKELETAIRKKLESQHLNKESRGIVLNKNSSLAKSLVNSRKFNEYLAKNVVELAMKDKLPNSSLSFGLLNSSPNNSLSIHNCDIRDIYLDNHNNIHAKIIDTVDYNLNEPIVKIPRKFQEHGLIENYYIIVEIVIPYEKWKKYLK